MSVAVLRLTFDCRCGVEPGDVITQVDGHPISSVNDLQRYLSKLGFGCGMRSSILAPFLANFS